MHHTFKQESLDQAALLADIGRLERHLMTVDNDAAMELMVIESRLRSMLPESGMFEIPLPSDRSFSLSEIDLALPCEWAGAALPDGRAPRRHASRTQTALMALGLGLVTACSVLSLSSLVRVMIELFAF